MTPNICYHIPPNYTSGIRFIPDTAVVWTDKGWRCKICGKVWLGGGDVEVSYDATSNIKETLRALWIPLSERLPEEEHTDCLWVLKRDNSIGSGWFMAGRDAFMSDSGLMTAVAEVSHWLPFPAPPLSPTAVLVQEEGRNG